MTPIPSTSYTTAVTTNNPIITTTLASTSTNQQTTLTTSSPICQDMPSLQASCSYFTSLSLTYCNSSLVFINKILFSQACQKSCMLCSPIVTTSMPTTTISTTTTMQTTSSCADLISYCLFWSNNCNLLANLIPHPCKKTCKLC